uniref:NADH-ubiquinone oxidoreductase chain 6 n=1 Tax=Anthicidae sp. 1 ACP-2013 TaxID=1434426 RepID=A0A3G5FNI1_9CUCU|nr:NADH dehydrogenase subunit 6 [Anthicidae sp. 1 ACP-2013]
MVLMMTSLSITLMFMFMMHPLSMGMMLLIQTLMVSLMTGKFCINYWFSYILFLILIGGMLILFMYMTSIASNEKFKPNMKFIVITPIMLSTLLFPETWKFMSNTPIMKHIKIEALNNLEMSMIKFIHLPLNMILMFMILYLLLTLIAIVKITNMSSGPLRPKN